MPNARYGGAGAGKAPALASAFRAVGALVPILGFMGSMWLRPCLAATTPVASVPYAQQIAQDLDAYVGALAAQLRTASILGPRAFDAGSLAVMGPAGEWLPMVEAVRAPDGTLGFHPARSPFLSADTIREALDGHGVFVQDGQLVVVYPTPGGASAVAVAVPLSEVGARLPDFSKTDGVAIYDAEGHLLAGTSPPADQASLLSRDLPQAQGSMELANNSQPTDGTPPGPGTSASPSSAGGMTRFEIARSADSTLVVVARMPSTSAPEPAVLGTLFPAPAARPYSPPTTAPSRPRLNRRMIILASFGLSGLLLGIIILIGRSGSRKKKIDPPAMRGVDYLDALSEAPELKRRKRRPRPKPDTLEAEPAPQGEPQEAFAGDDTTFETSVAAMAADVEPELALAVEPQNLEPEAFEATQIPTTVDTLEEAPPPPITDPIDTPTPKSRRGPRRQKVRGLSLFWNKETTPEPPSLEELDEPIEFARLVEAAPDPATAAAERASHIETFRSSRDRDALRAARAVTPHPARQEGSRSGAAEGRLEDSMRRTVRPQEVLLTKGEAQSLIDKESDRVVARISALLEEVEARGDGAVADVRRTFGTVLEQFETLQDDRKRDLATIYDLKHDIENELTSATLKIKQSEGKATEGLMRLSDRVEDLARKVEGWISDQRMTDERLSGALAALRTGWESQIDAQGELRRALRDALDDSQSSLRRLESALDREASERKGEIERLHHEIRSKMAQDDQMMALSGRLDDQVAVLSSRIEHQVTALAGQLDDIKSGQSNLHHRIDKTETQQRQALESIDRKLDTQDSLDGVKRQIGHDLETLKSRTERGDAGLAELKTALDKVQTDIQQEQTLLLNQLYLEIDKTKEETTLKTSSFSGQVETLREENAQLQQRQQHMLQLLSNLHSALGKSDARTLEEVERLKAQNTELQQMLLHLVKGGRPAANPPAQAAPPGPTPPPVGRPPVARPQQPAHQEPPEASANEGKPIDLWGRLMGRSGEEDSQRRRRPS